MDRPCSPSTIRIRLARSTGRAHGRTGTRRRDGNVASGGVASDGGDACAGEVLARVLGEPWLVAAPPFPVATVAPAGQVSVLAHVENGNITVFEHESTALCGRDEGFELNNFSRLMIVAAQIELLERTQQQDVWCGLSTVLPFGSK